MHQIASSDNAASFLHKAAYRYSVLAKSLLNIMRWKFGKSEVSMVEEENKNGQTWLEILVSRGNIKAVDACLSPKNGLAWKMISHGITDYEIESLWECVINSKNVHIIAILKEFIKLKDGKRMYDLLINDRDQTEEALLANEELASIKDSSENRKKFIQLCQDVGAHHQARMRRNIFLHFIQRGFVKLFRMFFEDNRERFINFTYQAYSRVNQQEYIQPELSTFHDTYPHLNEGVDIISTTIIGGSGHVPSRGFDRGEEGIERKKEYFNMLSNYADKCIASPDHPSDGPCSWLAYLKERCGISDLKSLVEYKISLLEDDESLPGRLDILNYLINDNKTKATTNNPLKYVMTAIRFRQCGMLRWLIENNHFDLDEKVQSIEMMVYADKFHFIPTPSMTTVEFLCLACVEWDDLYSLQWLHEQCSDPIRLTSGFNLLHLSAFLGRIEIVAWLYTTHQWDALVNEVSEREPYSNCKALHIAAGEAHVLIVDLLIKFGCDEEELVDGRTLHDFALSSGHVFVQEWVKKRETNWEMMSKPSELELNVQQLLHLLSTKDTPIEDIKRHIIDTKCLHIDSWGYGSKYDTMSSFGTSFGEVVNECCKRNNFEFVEWLCVRMVFWPSGYSYLNFWSKSNDHVEEPKRHGHDELMALSKNMGLVNLTNILSKNSWTKSISCIDPLASNLFSLSALKDDKLLSQIQSNLFYANAMSTLCGVAHDQISSLLRNGGSVEDINQLIGEYKDIRLYLEDEGYLSKDLVEEWYCIEKIAKKMVLSMEGHNYSNDYIRIDYTRNDHPLNQTNFSDGKCLHDLCSVHIMIAMEGYSELVQFCKKNFYGWTNEMEFDVVLVAAYYGHHDIVDMFLSGSEDKNLSISSPMESRVLGAMLGASEAGWYQDIIHYNSLHLLPISDSFKQDTTEDASTCNSLAYTTVYAILENTHHKDTNAKSMLEVINMLVDHLNYSIGNLLSAVDKVISYAHVYQTPQEAVFERSLDFFNVIKMRIGFDLVTQHKHLLKSAERIMEFVFLRLPSVKMNDDNNESFCSKMLLWLNDLIKLGVDIQTLKPDHYRHSKNDKHQKFLESIKTLRQEQVEYWAQFDVIKKKSLSDVQSALEDRTLDIEGRDKGGLQLTHLAGE